MNIHEAAKDGNIDAIKSAVEQGCDVNGRDKDGKTPLWYAAQSGHAEACRYLLAEGASIRTQNPSILEIAIQGGHADIVALLWPHCDPAMEHRSIESAISLGFHEIADFLIETGRLEYLNSDYTNSRIQEVGFPERVSAAFQQWERFLLFDAGSCRLCIIYFWTMRFFSLQKQVAMQDFVWIMVNEEIETPLTAAAENGNLEVLAALINHPNTDVTICGKYNWPAFLHLLASSQSISTERGCIIARRLSYGAPSHRFFTGSHKLHLECTFSNVLRFGDDDLVKQVIDLVHGEAGIIILPLLIRANEVDGVKWILNSDAVSSLEPPPDFWVLLCQYFQRHEDQNALELFTRVAEFLVENKTWNQLVLKCVSKGSDGRTLTGLPAASADQSLIKEWTDQEFASAALWDAIHHGLWTSPAFETLLLNSNTKSLNRPDPHRAYRGKLEPVESRRAFFKDLSSKGERIFVRSPPGPPPPTNLDLTDDRFTDYQLQLNLLEQQNKRRILSARDTRCPLSWAITNQNAPLVDTLLLSPQVNVNSQNSYGLTPLMHAIEANNKPIVEKLLNHVDIDLNLRDDEDKTAIFYAAQGDDLDIVRLLVGTQKVDYSIRNRNGQTVQEFAKKTKKKKDVVAALSN